jgi:DNA ligase-associated metallophosphoesterase
MANIASRRRFGGPAHDPMSLHALAYDPAVAPSETTLGGLACALDISGALHVAAHDTLLVADLHLEKGSSRARRGFMLPPYDTKATLDQLAAVVERYDPAVLVAMGDSFHDVGGPERLSPEDRETLSRLQEGRRWIWITGNHDRSISGTVGGEVATEWRLADVVLRHEPTTGPEPEIAGHLHPVGKVVMRGRSVRRRCFVSDGQRMVMPAFGAYTGGLNVCEAAFQPLFPSEFEAHLIGTERLYRIGRAQLCRD